KLTTNQPIKHTQSSITPYPNTLTLQNPLATTNNPTQKNLPLLRHIHPPNYFITLNFPHKLQQFQITSKPTPPTIITTPN
ncbi:hypothetical protein, partial [Staphylococcus epidermidis]|uniref:hypothetical protein n=1 Tax=Staphylococcus epidermidis TaxID=1282 RepID=UPI001C92EC6F